MSWTIPSKPHGCCFLRYLEDFEKDRADLAEMSGERYQYIIEEDYRWSVWAAPKDEQGKFDHNRQQKTDNNNKSNNKRTPIKLPIKLTGNVKLMGVLFSS
ncbi:hypothetical protein [Candidatus Sororendozoicomonas aggregata]|uniref:hypothetical protein n=1 Tax=Candidatus Sororendozoicomonas aggregata TaxID=3073239 RepID=UPI002ED31F60